MRMKLFELPHLAGRAPTQIAAPRFTHTGPGDRIEVARREESRGQFMGQALVLHETVLSGRANGLFVHTHCIGVSPLDASDLSRHQSVSVGERRWKICGPL